MSVRVEGFKFAALNAKVRKNIAGAVNNAAESCISLGQQLAPVDTGFMRSNIAQTEVANADKLKAVVESGADYSAFVEYGCFTRKSYKILTKRGYVPFSEIQEGEEVLTHLNRWRRVEKKHEFKSETRIPTVALKTQRGTSVTVTQNHKFFTHLGFVDAAQLSIGDEVQSIHNDLPAYHWKNFMETSPWRRTEAVPMETIKCVTCGTEFEERVSYTKQQGHPRKFCSASCYDESKAGNQHAKGKTWTLSEKQKERFQGRNNPMFQKERAHYYSEIGYREDLGHKVKSTWEANYARTLKASGIPYQYEPITFKLATGSYTPDFLVYDPVKGEHFVEIKGYMTEKSENKIREFLVRYPDSKLIVIGESEYLKLAAQWKDKVFWESKVSRRGSQIKFLWDVITEIRQSGNNGRACLTVYDLTVEEDHSYTLQHLVCHNTVNMDAQPFFTPSFESARRQLNNELLRVL